MNGDAKKTRTIPPAGDPRRVAPGRDALEPHDTRDAAVIEGLSLIVGGLLAYRRQDHRDRLGSSIVAVLVEHPRLRAGEISELVDQALCDWHPGQTPAWHVDEALRDLEVAGVVERNVYPEASRELPRWSISRLFAVRART